jgi:hypothetical protein
MTTESSRGPEVPAHEDLLRGIVRPEWWDANDKHLSSGAFAFAKFSAFIESLTTEARVAAHLPNGSGIIRFNAGVARSLGFDARHDPEDSDDSHAHVYCDLGSDKRKKKARKLIETVTWVREPNMGQAGQP